jgi:hypothetical protein
MAVVLHRTDRHRVGVGEPQRRLPLLHCRHLVAPTPLVAVAFVV